MKILFVSDAQSIHTKRWALEMCRLGHDVHVASFRDASLPGVTTHLLGTMGLGKIGYFLALSQLRKIFRREKPDVVHAQHLTSYGFLAALAKLKPLVVTAWGTDVLVSPKNSLLARFFVRYAMLEADAVTTVAEHMNSAVTNLCPNLTRLVAIPFGVDTTLFSMAKEVRPQRTPVRIICTRNFAPVYSVHTLLDAVAKLREDSVEIELVLLGAGPLRESLERQAARLGISDVVRFDGHVTQTRLVECLQSADIFVSPAISDGNNISLNEAMACGCFPVATKIAANTQWIVHGENGFLFEPEDSAGLASALRLAIENFDLRRVAESVNREIVEQRASWAACVAKMLGTYDSLCRGRLQNG